MRRFFFIIVLLFFTMLFSGCATVYNPVTQREEMTLINASTEKALGVNVSKQIEAENKLVKDKQILLKVKKIGYDVATQSGRRDIQFHFNIIDSDKINAVAIPGGHIYLYKGLLEKATDDELACIIGHEIAHIDARHGVKKLQSALGYQLLVSLALKGKKYKDMIKYANITFDLVSKSYSRRDELEADRVGVKYAYKAGYNPESMISFLNKLKEIEKTSSYNIEFLSTHPNYETRILYLKSVMSNLRMGGK